MEYPSYQFDDLDVRVGFKDYALSFLEPVVYERKGFLGAWKAMSKSMSFEMEYRSDFVRMTPERRQQWARLTAERWAKYRADREAHPEIPA